MTGNLSKRAVCSSGTAPGSCLEENTALGMRGVTSAAAPGLGGCRGTPRMLCSGQGIPRAACLGLLSPGQLLSPCPDAHEEAASHTRSRDTCPSCSETFPSPLQAALGPLGGHRTRRTHWNPPGKPQRWVRIPGSSRRNSPGVSGWLLCPVLSPCPCLPPREQHSG